MNEKRKRKVKELIKHIILWMILIAALMPIYLMLNISLKDNQQFARNPWLPEAPYHFENYSKAWDKLKSNIFNSIFVSLTTVVLMLMFSVMGAFFFARYKHVPGANFLFYIFLILMMYPGVANMVPTFKLITSIHLYNSHWALILLGISSGQAFTIFVLKNFIEEIPKDLFDAASIDGCSPLQQIRYVVIPLSMPIIGTLLVLRIINQWNRFVASLIMIRDSHKHLISVALLHMEGEYTKQWGELMAGYTIAALPLVILFFFGMRAFIRGLGEGALKE